jgi:hypothetical protein
MRFRPGARVLRFRLGLVVTILSAVACAPVPDRARHSVEDYLTNPELRHAEFELCAKDPGTLEKAPDCINVREAERRAGVGIFRELTPLQLPEKK